MSYTLFLIARETTFRAFEESIGVMASHMSVHIP